MAINVLRVPSGFIPVGSGSTYLELQEISLVGKTNYRVEISFNNLFNGAKFEYRPDANLKMLIDLNALLVAAFDTEDMKTVSKRLLMTYVKYQAIWTESSDAEVRLFRNKMYIYLAQAPTWELPAKRHVDFSTVSKNKFLNGSNILKTTSGRPSYIEWLYKDTVLTDITTSASNLITPDDPGLGTACRAFLAHTTSMGALTSATAYTKGFSLKFKYRGGSISMGFGTVIGLGNSANSFQWLIRPSSFTWGRYNIFNYTLGLYVDVDLDIENDVFEIAYLDGAFYQIYNGLILGTQAAGDVNYYFQAQLYYYTQGLIDAEGKYGSVSDIELEQRASWLKSTNITKDSDFKYRKTAGGTGWNEKIYSSSSFSGGFVISFSFNADMLTGNTDSVAVGYATDPTLSNSYTNIKAGAIFDYNAGASRVRLVEAGVIGTALNIGRLITKNDHFSFVAYVDGNGFRICAWYMNGVAMEGLSITDTSGGTPVSPFISFYDTASSLIDIDVEKTGAKMELYKNNGSDILLETLWPSFKYKMLSFKSSAYLTVDLGTLKIIVSTYTIASLPFRVFQECSDAVYIEFLNAYGGYTTWMFEINQSYSLTPRIQKKYKMLRVYADNLTFDEWLMFNELLKTAAVYNDDFKIGLYIKDITDRKRVMNVITTEDDSNTVQTKSIGFPFSMKLKYPTKYYN